MTSHNAPSRLILFTLLILASALSSCNEKSKTNTQTLPKITDLTPAGETDNGTPKPAEPALDPEQPAINPRARLSIERLLFRRSDWKVDVALRSLEQTKLDTSVGLALRDSGFFISQLPLDRLPLFRANLPGPISLEVNQITPMADYTPVTLVSQITGRRVGRAVDDSGQLQTITTTGGAYRLLARLAADNDGRTLVDIVPQHYLAKITAELRPPGQRVMDGVVFSAMRVKQAIEPQMVWLIWADPPPADKPTLDPALANATGAMQSDPPPTTTQPPLLGTMMLNGLRGQQPVRMVLVVYVTQ